jgi:hypothetical protein
LCWLAAPGRCEDAGVPPADGNAPSAVVNAGVSSIATLRYGDAADDSAAGGEPRPPGSLAAASRIQGRLTWMSPRPAAGHHFVVQDDSSGIWVNVKVARERGVWQEDDATLADLVPGMLVEVEGFVDRDVFSPMIIPQSVTVLSAEQSLPEATPAMIDRVFNGADNCQRVEIEGVLQGFRKASGRWILVMETDGHRWLVTVPDTMLQPDPAHLVDGSGRRSDERDALGGDGTGEVGVLGEEAVTGVHAVGAALLDGVENGLGVEVTLGRSGAAERICLVGEAHVESVAIQFAVDRDGGDTEFAGGSDDSDGDLATIGDQDAMHT